MAKKRFLGSQSLVFFGPPGVGKTTLMLNLIKLVPNKEVVFYKPAIETLIDLKKKMSQVSSNSTILFIDEIHRLDKRQQDYLLPILESGETQLLGATTENPFVIFNNALLSRIHLQELQKLNKKNLLLIAGKICVNLQIEAFLNEKIITSLIHHCDGDSRKLISFIEVIHLNISNGERSEQVWFKQLSFNAGFDLDRHYNLLSALIKSMRAGEIDESIGWLSQYLTSGGDPLVIGRRLIVFASEDVGNAAPFALTLAVSTFEAVKNIGMPESRIILCQTVSYLSKAPKSRASMDAISFGFEHAREYPNLVIPNIRLNKKQNISYPVPDFPKFYVPSGNGHES